MNNPDLKVEQNIAPVSEEKLTVKKPEKVLYKGYDGKCYTKVENGLTLRRVNPFTGETIPRVRLSKKKRIQLRHFLEQNEAKEAIKIAQEAKEHK